MTVSVPRLVNDVTAQDHVSGARDAVVTLVEYGDYECPHCAQAYPIVKALERELGDWLRVCFRHFPLTTAHPHAKDAAEAAEAAGTQHKFWQMHGLLFEHQDALEYAQLFGYALALGLDRLRFMTELANHRHAARVRADFRSGVRSGVNGTPTFFINGVRHDDGYAFDTLLNALEAARAMATPARASL